MIINNNIQIVIDKIDAVKQIPGCIAEFGVYQGDSIIPIAARAKEVSPDKMVYGFDSFEGLPSPTDKDDFSGVPTEKLHKVQKGYFGDTSISIVESKIKSHGLDNVILVPGWFDKTLSDFKEDISLLFLDCDFYDSYKIVLEMCWDLLMPGGIVIFDEYDSIKYKGARKAVDEFFDGTSYYPICDHTYDKPGCFKRYFLEK